MTTMESGQHFRQGKLGEAIAAAEHFIRQHPADVGSRILLAEYLLFADEFERADAVLVAAEAVEPEAALVVAEFRQLLRAASARQQLFRVGRVPEFLGAPTTAQTESLRAMAALRAGDPEAAARAAADAETCRPAVSGTVNGAAFTDLRDADDLCAGSFEVLTTTGKYYWVPSERVASMEFHPPKRPRDLFWRRCTMSVREGPDGDVYLPALYDTPSTAAELLRLGRRTEWSDTAPVCGSGQRVFLVGDEGIPVTLLETVEFA